MNRVRILGIGSPSGDDQAGWLAVEALQDIGVEAHLDKLDRPGANLVSLLEHTERVILIDAMQSGGAPGRIIRFDEQDWSRYRQGLSSHGFGVLDALSLAQALGCLPRRLELFGIEIASANPGETPGTAVRAAARQLAATIAAGLASA